MENVNDDGEDMFNIVCGDLGLGESTRSRSYLKFGQGYTPIFGSDAYLNETVKNGPSDSEIQESSFVNAVGQDALNSHEHLTVNVAHEGAKNRSIAGSNKSLNVEDFPTYADVPYGTSLRQQKKLFEQQIDNLRKQFAANLEDASKHKDSKRSNSFKMTGKEIETKLYVALQEMEELKIELDACRQRLDAKYKAVAILKEQADLADTELKKTERRASETSRRLEQHGEGQKALVEDLEDRAVGHISPEMLDLELQRVCQENVILMSKLGARNEELRRANAHKSAIARERDELLALVDVTERLKYEQGKSKIAEEDYGTFTSTELAVLGACKCRVSSPEPCGCAHAAANLRKEVAKLREELELNQERREEANLTIDAYRTAFEEQLAKSRKQSLRLSEIATISSRSTKAKAAIKWLIQVLSDDDDLPARPAEQGMEAEKGNQLSNMSLQELVTVLTDMVHEKNEALAHQKLASQVLANKLYKYEKKESRRLEGGGSNTDLRSKRQRMPSTSQTPCSSRSESDVKGRDREDSCYDEVVSPNSSLSREDEVPVFKYIAVQREEDDGNVSDVEDEYEDNSDDVRKGEVNGGNDKGNVKEVTDVKESNVNNASSESTADVKNCCENEQVKCENGTDLQCESSAELPFENRVENQCENSADGSDMTHDNKPMTSNGEKSDSGVTVSDDNIGNENQLQTTNDESDRVQEIDSSLQDT